MPYEVRSQCDRCGKGDLFLIGMWRVYMGVYICRDRCKKIINIPVETGKCPGCGREVRNSDLFDYADFIPYLDGGSVAPLEPGPICPKCGRGQLSFDTIAHCSMFCDVPAPGFVTGDFDWNAHYSTFSDVPAPGDWRGKHYLEKEIFAHAVMAAAFRLKITPEEAFAHFGLEITDPIIDRMTRSCLTNKGLSTPILMEIRIDFDSYLSAGERLPRRTMRNREGAASAAVRCADSKGANPQPGDEDLDWIVMLIAYRNNQIRCFTGEWAEYAPKNERQRQEYQETIAENTRRLEGYLKKRQGSTRELSPALRDAIIERQGYYVDMHPEARYAGGPLAGTPVLYVGHIVDKLSTEVDAEGHLFLVCRSDGHRAAGTPYASYLQPEAFQVYTHADVTWVDQKEPVECASRGELETLRKFGVLGPDESKNNNETTLRECDPEHLRRLKAEGKANFDALAQKRPPWSLR
jgi:hypothetical protein